MTLLLRFCGLLLAGSLLANPALAQLLPTAPLGADPGRAARHQEQPAGPLQQRGTTVVALPFFDDFTSPIDGPPKVANWEPRGGALVSNRFAVEPLTRGAVTLDGLRANGKSYSNSETSIFTSIDSLVSQPINLSGLQTTDSVALSFAWQAGSIIGPPEPYTNGRPVRLDLEFKSNTVPARWTTVWTYRSTGQRTAFRQQVVLINDAQYLHGNFQFRFKASGNSSQASDIWGIDYVLLDRSRGRQQRVSPLADTTFVDVATSAGFKNSLRSGGLRSPLRRYAAMPVWQYNAAASPSSELSAAVGVNIMNLNREVLPRPIDVQGTLRELPSGAQQVWLARSKLASAVPRLDTVLGDARHQPIASTASPKRLRYTLALNTRELTPRTLANDTIFRDVDLNNYYAYDDGTAEYSTFIADNNGAPASYLAYRFELNQADQVRALRLYPVFTAADRGARTVTINVWSDDSGRPSSLPVATKTATIPNPLPAGWEYYEIAFDQPVDVSGTFYVGYGQAGRGIFLHYGLDRNSTFPRGSLWRRNAAAVWDTVNFSPRGALMMRPVMNNRIASATTSPNQGSPAFTLYPNPAHASVTVSGRPFSRATVLDALGRQVWEQPAAEAGQPTLTLRALPPGVYLVRLALPDGSVATRRLLLE